MSVDRTSPPALESVRPFHPADVLRTTLPNGLSLLVARCGVVPLVHATLLVRSGSAAASDRPGLASLVASLLTEGSTAHTATEMADRIDFLGASLSAGASCDATYVELSVLSRELRAGLEILAEAGLRPAFPDRELERLRGMRLDSLKQARNNPSSLAADRFNELLYVGTPYAAKVIGDEATIPTLTRDELAAFHSASYVPSNAVLVLAGDLDPAAAAKLAGEVFGSWSGGAAPAAPAIVTSPGARRIVLVDRPQSVQSVIRIGHVSEPRKTPDYFPLAVMNSILGGKFTSRVNLNLRETHGYTYGARTAFEWRLGSGPFYATADVHNEVTKESVAELLLELDRIRESPVEPGELADAISYLQGVFPYTLETAEQLVGRLADLVLYGLPEDYLATFREKVGAVGADAIQDAAKKHLRPESALILVVGKAEQIAGPLGEIGSVEVVDGA